MANIETPQEMVTRVIASRDLDTIVKDGQTPLTYVINNGDIDLMALLISAGANVNEPDTYGHTPLYYAIANDEFDAVKKLIKAGAKPSVEDIETSKNPVVSEPIRIALRRVEAGPYNITLGSVKSLGMMAPHLPLNPNLTGHIASYLTGDKGNIRSQAKRLANYSTYLKSNAAVGRAKLIGGARRSRRRSRKHRISVRKSKLRRL